MQTRCRIKGQLGLGQMQRALQVRQRPAPSEELSALAPVLCLRSLLGWKGRRRLRIAPPWEGPVIKGLAVSGVLWPRRVRCIAAMGLVADIMEVAG